MVRRALWKIGVLLLALGVSLIIWTMIVGLEGLDGPSIVKEMLWDGISDGYKNTIVSDTDTLGYGYTQRLSETWASVNNGVAYTDTRCTMV